jgi:flagellar hook-associated protein 3 FlgL
MPTRIATSQIYDRSQKNVATARERESITSDKAASGRELTRPSQDPAGYMISATLKDDLAVGETLLKNAELGSRVLGMTETVFTQLQDSTQRAYELAIASSGESVSSQASREFTIGEIENIYQSVLQTLNTRYGNRTLLAGHKSQLPAFDPNGNFLGDGGEINIEVGRGLKVPINISAHRAVLGQGVDNGINILTPFQNLIAGIKTNNTEMIHSTLEDFKKANNQISLARGEIGARMSQLDRAVSNQRQVKLDGTTAVSAIEDADAIKVFSDLARDHTVLQAAVSTTDKLLNNNPTDIFYK